MRFHDEQGLGEYGQIGHGVRGSLNSPRLVLAGKSIAQVAAGRFGGLFVEHEKALSQRDTDSRRRASFTFSMHCRYHSLALTSFGVLYSWGCGENGQLGHHEDADVFFPKVIEPNVGTVVGQISCGEHHTAVLTSTPWSRVDPEVAEWLHAEKEEYQFKRRSS